MSDSVERIRSWDAKFNTERVKQSLDAMREEMLKNYVSATTALCQMETQTKQVLDQAGVHTILYVPYLDFARQLFKLSRKKEISGNSFALAAQVLLDKWAGRGLNADVLALIRTQVFDVGEPIP